MRRRPLGLFVSLLAACAAAAAPCAAQVDAGLDASVAVVKYDGYLSSGAAALTPSLTWRSTHTTVGARSTLLFFESGNASLQGLLTANTFSSPIGPGRFEFGAEAGASTYAGVAQFFHTLLHARMHLMGSRLGIWGGGLAGVVAGKFGAVASAGASGLSAGAWARAPAGALEVTVTHLDVSYHTYTDLQGRARWRSGPVALEAVAGAREVSSIAGSSAYGDVSASLALAERVQLVFAVGNYPSDPVRGTIAGRYVTAGVRLATRPVPRPAPATVLPALPAPGSAVEPPRLEGVSVSIERSDGLAYLIVHASGAQSVEVMGDFTDWQPAVLAGAGAGRYRYALGVVTGVQRFNLRVDGGPWGVPEGVAAAADEFGGNVAVLVVP